MVGMWRASAVAVFVAVALAACGTDQLDTADLKSRVTADMSKKRDLSGIALTCPDKVDAKKGATMECQFTATASVASSSVPGLTPTGGSSQQVNGTVKVTLKDEQAKVYNYTGKYAGAGVSGELSSYTGLP